MLVLLIQRQRYSRNACRRHKVFHTCACVGANKRKRHTGQPRRSRAIFDEKDYCAAKRKAHGITGPRNSFVVMMNPDVFQKKKCGRKGLTFAQRNGLEGLVRLVSFTVVVRHTCSDTTCTSHALAIHSGCIRHARSMHSTCAYSYCNPTNSTDDNVEGAARATAANAAQTTPTTGDAANAVQTTPTTGDAANAVQPTPTTGGTKDTPIVID